MGIIECKSKSVLEWLLTFVTLGFFYQTHVREKLGTQTHDLCLLRSPRLMLACGKDKVGHNFP